MLRYSLLLVLITWLSAGSLLAVHSASRAATVEKMELTERQRAKLAKKRAKLNKKIAKKQRKQHARDIEITTETLLWIAVGVGVLLLLALLGLGGLVATLLWIVFVVALIVGLVLLILYLTQQ